MPPDNNSFNEEDLELAEDSIIDDDALSAIMPASETEPLITSYIPTTYTQPPTTDSYDYLISPKKNKKTVMEQPSLSFVCVECKRKIDESEHTNSYGSRPINEKNECAAICSKCLKYFSQCELCRTYFYKTELQLNHCAPCIEMAPKHYIHNYKYKVQKDFPMIGKEPKDKIYYGIELELESENLGLDVLIVHSLVKEFALLKRDSSIKHGFEIVSAPAVIESHYELWDNFFEKLPKTCHPLSSCGMHVHASRDRMSDLQIGKILEFIHSKDNQEFIKLIAGREKPVFLGNEKGYNELEPKKIADMKVRVDRHTALNLNNLETIEFRIFWATRDKRIFFKNIEFCRAIIKWTDWAMTSIKEAVDYKQFIEFVKKNRKDYEYLCLFFETPSMKRLLES